jgi:antirestriction protein ArdC
MLERGVAPWQKPWEAGAGSLGIPFNPNSDRAYRGGNAIHLMAIGLERGYEDPRWMTYKQASDNGWQVRRGEKGTQIEYWEVKSAPDKTELSRPDGAGDGSAGTGNNADTEKSRFVHRVYNVFNALSIPAKANTDSGGNANGIPGRRRAVFGAQRRWHFDCGTSVRLRQGKPVRSAAEEERR